MRRLLATLTATMLCAMVLADPGATPAVQSPADAARPSATDSTPAVTRDSAQDSIKHAALDTALNPALKDSTAAFLSPEQSDALVRRAIEESNSEGNNCTDAALLQCLGLDSAQCSGLMASVIRQCTMPLARKILSEGKNDIVNVELEHAKCTFALGKKDFDIQPERYMSCMPEGTFQNPKPIQEWLNHNR